MAKANGWTREQLLVALNLYCRTKFGRLHAKNPDIIEAASRIGRSPGALAMKCCNFASLDPLITNSGRVGLKGASNADREIWQEATNAWSKVLDESIEIIEQLNIPNSENSVTDIAIPSYDTTDSYFTAKGRKGQSLFRKMVLTSYNNQCCITGLTEPKLIVASHIVPWHKNEAHRLNPHNGLALNMLHDKAFDQGLITIDDDLTVRVSNRLKQQNEFTQQAIVKFHGQPLRLPERFMPNRDFLAQHRQEIFV